MRALEAKMNTTADADGLFQVLALRGAVIPDRTALIPA
jgi:hypothetical protein